MKTTEFTKPITANQLNENMYKKFGVKVNFDKYDRSQLENYRNLLRTKISQVETASNFNDLLANESYQKDKQLVNLLNTKIKEMLGESKAKEGNAFGKAVRDAKADGVKKDEKIKVGGKTYPVKEEGERTMSRAAKGVMKYGKDGMKALAKAGKEGKDLDKVRDKYDKYDESAKPDFLDMDKDGNKKETMKKAIADKKKKPFAKKDESVEEGWDDMLAANKKKADEKGTGKFDKKKTSTGTVYTRKSNTFTDGGDDKDVKKAKKKVKESFQYVREDEEAKAKSITAGSDMVNDFTSWMTRVGQYQTKSMIELADAIRANFGAEQSEQFKASVAPALETALNTLTQAREEISNAVAVLSGESPAIDQMGGDMDAGMDDMNAGSEEIPGSEDEMNMDTGADEFGASDAAAGGAEQAGRMRRESRQTFARKLSEAHSLLKTLSK